MSVSKLKTKEKERRVDRRDRESGRERWKEKERK